MASQATAKALVQSLSGSSALNVSKLFSVSGWVAVVTGGGTGLGLVTAIALAQNGAKVYISGRRLAPIEEAAAAFAAENGNTGGKIIPVQADASDKGGIQKLVAAVSAEEKFINLLVNNHGVCLPRPDINACEQTADGLSKHMFENETFDAWLDCYRINTASYYFTTFAFLSLLSAAKTVGGYPEPGNVINIASMSGITKTSQRGQFSYNASKAALISLSNMLACEFARRGLGVRVNAVCPGYFPSGMTPIVGEEALVQTDNCRNNWGIPFGRAGNATDYAQCILGLAVNQYVTGAEHVIDGAWLLDQPF